MKKFARIISIIMALCFILSSCGGSETAGEITTVGDVTTSAETTSGVQKPSTPVDEFTLPLEEGHNQLTLYWTHNDGYEDCDIWMWWGDKAGQGYTFHECSYGGKVVVNVPFGVEEVGFIVRRDCSEPGGTAWGSATKDFDQDRFAVIDGRETVIYLKPGVADQYTSNDGGKTLVMIKKFSLAGMTDENTIQFRVTPNVTISSLDQVKVYDGDREIAVQSVSSMGMNMGSGYIYVAEPLDISGNYRVSIAGYGDKAVVPTGIFDSKYFADNYHYDGKDLGATVNGDSTVFKLWAPTASKVVLNLFTAGNDVDAYKQVELVRGDKGVWSHTEACGHGTYYTYSVTTAVGTQEAVDPYAKAAGVNGDRGMVVDLSRTNPDGWDSDSSLKNVSSYSEAIIWEIHVRDFSNKISSSQYKGKYLAFTENGLVNEHGQAVGVDYLKDLGITHVHLLPVYDYASVDETAPDKQFNWGYDPENYNVPEGSYSTDPYNGEVRIKEFKQMVMALHKAGIGVIMDVVYNHTYDANSSFNKIVPYYYYRYTTSGANSSASGCGNDTASERYMYGKFMVESTSYWMDEYNLDGFRFDLMGLHDLATMQEVESAVHTINPNALIYGEGWTMGSTIDGSAQANQGQISNIKPTGDAIGSIAVFNDVIRDGLKGSVFEKTAQGFINGAPNSANLLKVMFSMKGGAGSGYGWSVKDSMVINYMSAHDNNTLWDKLLLSNANASDAERAAMNKLGAAIILASKGTPFWQAGEEMLRTKGGDENSYMSSDEVNNIDWSVLKEGSAEYEMMLYYKGLIEMRKTFGIFSNNATDIQYTQLASGVVAVTFDDGNGGKALFVMNPHRTALPYTLDAEWNLVADAASAGSTAIARESGSVTLAAYSVRIYVNDALLK
jgi:pullulanase